eukprot:gene5835-6532_t
MTIRTEDQIPSTSSNNSTESESGDAILSILLNNPEELELQHRPSGIRRNLVFTLNKRVVSIASAKSDDNGAYLTKATARKQYYYNNDVNVLECKTVHQNSNGSYYHNVREARGYKAQFVPKNNVYEVVRCYRQNKSNPAFSQTIATARKMTEEEIMPYYLVTYKWSDGIDHSAEFKMPRHGNARKPDTCPYYRQDPDVLQEIDSMLDKGHSTDKIYTTLANRATSTVSETVKCPKVIANRKFTNSASTKTEFSEAESILRSLRMEGSFKDIFRSARNLWCTQHLENRDVEKLRALGCNQRISKKRQEVPSFLDPDRQQSGEYQLVHRDDTKSCPKSVSRCQQCRIAFQSSDVVLIKTTGVREITDKDGKQKRYTGNIYLHYLTKCLMSYDQKFDFVKVNVPKGTQELLPAHAVESLRAKGLTLVDFLQGPREYRCCGEIAEASGKLTFDGSIERIPCITKHEDFQAVTNTVVLEMTGHELRDRIGRRYRQRAGQSKNE